MGNRVRGREKKRWGQRERKDKRERLPVREMGAGENAKSERERQRGCQRESAERSSLSEREGREITSRRDSAESERERGENGEEIERVTGEVVTTKIFVMNITFITKDL